MRPRRVGAVAVLLLTVAGSSWAQSPACQQAAVIVDQVERQYEAPNPDHADILRRLSTARNLCPSLGVAWKHSYCSARALGDSRQADIFQRRAAFNQVRDLTCSFAEGRVVGPRSSVGPVRNKFALLVGISSFRDPAIPELRFAAKDARDLAAALVDPCLGRFPPGNVRVLTDEEATRENILEALNRLILEAQADDLVLLFFSTHGSPARSDRGLGGMGHLVTYDTELEQVWLNGLEFRNLKDKADLIKARRLVTILDSCYSGQVRDEGGKDLVLDAGGISARDAELLLSGEGSYVLSSSAESQLSWESEELENGFFTHFLIEGLRQDGAAPTLGEVFHYLSREVTAAVAREKQRRQEPQMFPRDLEADIRIGVAPAEESSVSACTETKRISKAEIEHPNESPGA